MKMAQLAAQLWSKRKINDSPRFLPSLFSCRCLIDLDRQPIARRVNKTFAVYIKIINDVADGSIK